MYVSEKKNENEKIKINENKVKINSMKEGLSKRFENIGRDYDKFLNVDLQYNLNYQQNKEENLNHFIYNKEGEYIFEGIKEIGLQLKNKYEPSINLEKVDDKYSSKDDKFIDYNLLSSEKSSIKNKINSSILSGLELNINNNQLSEERQNFKISSSIVLNNNLSNNTNITNNNFIGNNSTFEIVSPIKSSIKFKMNSDEKMFLSKTFVDLHVEKCDLLLQSEIKNIKKPSDSNILVNSTSDLLLEGKRTHKNSIDCMTFGLEGNAHLNTNTSNFTINAKKFKKNYEITNNLFSIEKLNENEVKISKFKNKKSKDSNFFNLELNEFCSPSSKNSSLKRQKAKTIKSLKSMKTGKETEYNSKKTKMVDLREAWNIYYEQIQKDMNIYKSTGKSNISISDLADFKKFQREFMTCYIKFMGKEYNKVLNVLDEIEN